MQAFVLWEGHPNIVAGGKRPRTTLTPTVVLRDGKPFLALSSPGGDSQDQQALQVLLNLAVFGMRPQEVINRRASTRSTTMKASATTASARASRARGPIAPRPDALGRLGYKVQVIGLHDGHGNDRVAGRRRPRTVFGAPTFAGNAVTGW
jgi:gamma-glutamyltranspeptidase/glutathione hydrolase